MRITAPGTIENLRLWQSERRIAFLDIVLLVHCSFRKMTFYKGVQHVEKPRRILFLLLSLTLLVAMALPGMATAQDPTQITFWHAMSGSRAEVVQAIVDSFNEANPT